MRILLVAPLDRHSHYYIRRAFEKLGNEVFEYDYRVKGEMLGVRGMNENLLLEYSGIKPDLTVILKGEIIFPRYLAHIHPSVLWNFDFWYPLKDGSLYAAHAKTVDVFLTPCGGLVPEYRKLSINAHYLLEGFDPDLHHPVKLTEGERTYYGSDVSFVGTVKDVPGRPEWLKAVGERFNLKIWGSFCDPVVEKWHTGKRAGDGGDEDEEHNKIVSASKITLDRARDTTVHGAMSARVFRVLAAQGFLLMRHVQGVEDHFTPGVHLETFKDTEDCLEKIEKYLEDERRETVAMTGYSECLRNHTWTRRVEELLKLV